MLDGTTLLLSGTASLPPRTGRGVATSLLVAYWAVRLSISSVVHLKISFGARKGGGCCALHVPLSNAFDLGPWDHGCVPSDLHVRLGMGSARGIRVVHLHPSDKRGHVFGALGMLPWRTLGQKPSQWWCRPYRRGFHGSPLLLSPGADQARG
jgi:hypothetical protein